MKDFKKEMYKAYVANMTFYGKPILGYKKWEKAVKETAKERSKE